MRIIFVRHGHPDYARDCLTELGREQALAAARRLRGEGVERIFSSPCGRARETAACTAELLQLPVEVCEFMREITWGFPDERPAYRDASPWSLADEMVRRGDTLTQPDWMRREPFCDNRVSDCARRVAEETDRWLAGLGYAREGLYYRALSPAHKTVAVFSHGGSSSAMLSRLFNLPFPFVCAAMGPDFTAVTAVQLPEDADRPVTPRFELLNDARHIQSLTVPNQYGR